ncbi:MAG: hypothetical protein R3F11_25210 [Verrucomicrobiales bacterium]
MNDLRLREAATMRYLDTEKRRLIPEECWIVAGTKSASDAAIGDRTWNRFAPGRMLEAQSVPVPADSAFVEQTELFRSLSRHLHFRPINFLDTIHI